MITQTEIKNEIINTEKAYWDDLCEGQQFFYGSYQVCEQEIVDFASRFDPMDFHTDPEKAKLSPIGALCASGIHTLAIKQRLTFDNIYKNWQIVAGKQVKHCRFLRPVLVDDILTVNMTIHKLTETRRSDRGNVELIFLMKNDKQQTVLDVEAEIVLLKK